MIYSPPSCSLPRHPCLAKPLPHLSPRLSYSLSPSQALDVTMMPVLHTHCSSLQAGLRVPAWIPLVPSPLGTQGASQSAADHQDPVRTPMGSGSCSTIPEGNTAHNLCPVHTVPVAPDRLGPTASWKVLPLSPASHFPSVGDSQSILTRTPSDPPLPENQHLGKTACSHLCLDCEQKKIIQHELPQEGQRNGTDQKSPSPRKGSRRKAQAPKTRHGSASTAKG